MNVSIDMIGISEVHDVNREHSGIWKLTLSHSVIQHTIAAILVPLDQRYKPEALWDRKNAGLTSYAARGQCQ